MNSPGDFTTSPFLPTTGEIQTIGIAISPRKEGALPVTTRGMDKGESQHAKPHTVACCCPKMLTATGQNPAANGQSVLPSPVSLKLPLTPEANKIVRAKAYEYEQDFSTKVSQLADELREYPDWKQVHTKSKRTAAAVKFLIEKADGYRLPTPLAEEISEAAAIPLNIARTR